MKNCWSSGDASGDFHEWRAMIWRVFSDMRIRSTLADEIDDRHSDGALLRSALGRPELPPIFGDDLIGQAATVVQQSLLINRADRHASLPAMGRT
jgi:hypothetical protein